MPYYEHTFIARPDLTPQQAQNIAEEIRTLVQEAGGRVVLAEYWGLRNLAYRIKKHRKGHYLHLRFEAPKHLVREIEERERFNDDVLRFLTVKVDELSEEPSPILQSRSGRDERRR